MPECFVLEQNYPNPFNGFTTISYTLPQQAHVRLVVYNVYGRTVERFEPGNQPAGSFRLNWDGLDESGKNLASGLYLYGQDLFEKIEETLADQMTLHSEQRFLSAQRIAEQQGLDNA